MDTRIAAFLEIQKLLFQSLVLARCGMAEYDLRAFGTDPVAFIEVQLNDDLDQIEILEAATSHPTAWRKCVITKTDCSKRRLVFVEFFDWYPQDPMGRCSYGQVEVRVLDAASDSDSVRWVIPAEHFSFVAAVHGGA